MLLGSLSWDGDAVDRLRPDEARKLVAEESIAWQQLSQEGADAEMDAYPSLLKRQYVRDGVITTVPRAPALNLVSRIESSSCME